MEGIDDSFVLLLAVSDSVEEELLGVYRAGRRLGLLRLNPLPLDGFDVANTALFMVVVTVDFVGISRCTDGFDGD
jgi:hypothetical protein